MGAGSSGSTTGRSRRWPALLTAALVVLGALCVVVRLDVPADGTRIVDWSAGGVVVAVDPITPAEAQDAAAAAGLQDGDRVRAIAGHPVGAAPGSLAAPASGAVLDYRVDRARADDQVEQGDPGERTAQVTIARQPVEPLLRYGWGNLVFVVVLALLAVALYVRRPEEPATTPLLVASGGLLGSTMAVVAGIPALTMVAGGPLLWLYNLNVVGAYAVAWGAILAFGLLLPGADSVGRAPLLAAWLLPPAALLSVAAVGAVAAEDWSDWFGTVYAGTTVVVTLTLVAVVVLGVRGYCRSGHAEARARVRAVAVGSLTTAVLAIGCWHLPELVLGNSLLPPGALGLSGLPFIAGVAVALWRHRLFDIERLANRSLTYLAVTAVLVAGYALLVALLGNVLGLSGGVAAGVAAAAAAVALAPVLRLARRAVNRLMYGERDDPAGVLARLGSRMQAVLLPDEVLPAVVETVAHSLQLPYAAIDLPAVDPPAELAMAVGRPVVTDFRPGVTYGRPVGNLHSEELSHHGIVVGRLRVSDRGVDDALEPADLELLRSLAGEIGPAVQAVRLHQDLVRSRAEVVALREDERRRLRRDLHDGLGPALAAIGLKAGLAQRAVARTSPAYELLASIESEVKTSLGGIRRLVEGLRPPALDELGLLGAVRSRAASLAGELTVEVGGDVPPAGLPAAVETAAYWIVVEAMTNAARHSGGTHCSVDLRVFHDVIVVLVADDGAGIDTSRSAGVGLRSMRERAAEVGGTVLVLDGQPGTEVVARLPLDLGVSAPPTEPTEPTVDRPSRVAPPTGAWPAAGSPSVVSRAAGSGAARSTGTSR